MSIPGTWQERPAAPAFSGPDCPPALRGKVTHEVAPGACFPPPARLTMSPNPPTQDTHPHAPGLVPAGHPAPPPRPPAADDPHPPGRRRARVAVGPGRRAAGTWQEPAGGDRQP